MELLTTLLQFVLHLDQHLSVMVQSYGMWAYGILFAIIFCETGLVVAPFLPEAVAVLVTPLLMPTAFFTSMADNI